MRAWEIFYWLAAFAIIWMLGIGWARADGLDLAIAYAHAHAQIEQEIADAKLCKERVAAFPQEEPVTPAPWFACMKRLGYFQERSPFGDKPVAPRS